MSLARVIVAVRELAGLPPAALKGLHPPEQLRRILERERARAHRTGESLSLVMFTPLATADRAHTALLARLLRRRLRTTDEAGWLDERRVGVVLPATPAAGAWKVADDVCLGFSDPLAQPACAVYTHGPDGPADEPADAAAAPGSRPTFELQLLFQRRPPAWKRALDVAGAAAGLVLLAPAFAAIAVAIKLSSPGPVFFRQWRSGWGGRPFRMVKFRTMVIDAEARKAQLRALNEQDGPAFKVRNDPRITRVGRFLRQTSLDELPQLWNVLVGQMSLVGPRPLPLEETEACEAWHRRRLDVLPGLTCIWQVKGRSNVSFAEWIRMDLRYIRAGSPWQDLKLLLLTVPAVALRRGAH